LWAAVALYDVEFNALAFVQSLEAFADDRAEMHEHVIAAFNLDESEAFLRVEPFYGTLLHGCFASFTFDINMTFLFLSQDACAY